MKFSFSLFTALFLSTIVCAQTPLPNPDFTMTAKDLYGEFRPSIEAQSMAIKLKYTGKILRLTGVVKANSKSFGPQEIQLRGNESMGTVYCQVKTDAAAALAEIQKEQTITLQGVSTGWLIGPTLKDCVLAPEQNLAAQSQTTSAPVPVVEPTTKAAGEIYTNPLSKVSFELPGNFKKLSAQDMFANFQGPIIAGSVLSINVNAFPIPTGVSKDIMYQVNVKTYSNPALYSNFQEVTSIPNVKAFLVEEKPKTTSSEMHRRYLMLWGDLYQTNIMCAGSYEGVSQNKDLFDQVLQKVKVE